jgi:AraC-like DNA-binding protein
MRYVHIIFVTFMHGIPADRRSLSEIAGDISASARTLERLFKNGVGLSGGALIQQIRFIFSLELPADGKSVGDVVSAVGYQNPSSFIAAFR